MFNDKEKTKDYKQENNSKFDEIQNERIKSLFSIQFTEKILDEFSNVSILFDSMKSCEENCYKKYQNIYSESLNNEFFDYKNFLTDISLCSDKCEDSYKKVLDHQKKGAEISYVSKYS